ncbi:MAG: sporulation integral membrane protein YtvI [Defluviitaleaceae bacterium]|nr:sporulation integral membrane protein YtvI [Defluviitaleaceae bacterium]
MRDFFNEHKQLIDRAAFFALIAVVVYLFFTLLFGLLAPFFFGLIIALIMEPLVRIVVNKFRWKRWIASMLCLLLFIAAAGTLGVWLISALIRQMTAFVTSAPEHVEEIVVRINDATASWMARLDETLPETWQLPDLQEIIVPAITTLFGGEMLDQALLFAAGVPNFLVGMVLALVSAYFFMADRWLIFRTVRNSCPPWLIGHMRQTRVGLKRAVSGYFRAQYILMAMVGIISITGLLILRSPFPLLLGLLLAAVDFVPILGPAIILLPWALISLLVGDFHMAIGLGVIYGVITITRQVLQPKILGAQMGAHPLASLMSIFIGLRIFGLLGLIIGPSLLMVFIAVRERNDVSEPKEELSEECTTQKKEKSGWY